jgi:hypothetical protein
MADLQISPSELKFRFELRKTIPVTLTLTNPGNEKVAFKVKTTSPKKYCVRPSSGVVEPGSSKDVQVIMQVLPSSHCRPFAGFATIFLTGCNCLQCRADRSS